MRKGIIAIEKSGQTIDMELLTTACKLYPTGFGVSVVVEDDKGNKSLETLAEVVDGGNDAAALTIVKESFTEDFVIMTLFKQDGDVKEDDLQPYVLFKDGDNPLIVCFVSGELKKYQDKSGYSAEHQFVELFLKNKVNELFEKTEGCETVENLMDEIATNTDFQNAVTSEAGGDTVVVFHSKDDASATLSATKKDRSFTWGYLSDGEGFDPPTVGKKKSLLPTKSAVGSDSTLIKAKPVPSDEPKLVVVSIPETMTDNQRRVFIHKRMGSLPTDWKTLKEILIPYSKALECGDVGTKDFKDLKGKVGEYPEGKQAPQPYIPLIPAESKKKGDKFFDSLDPSKWKVEEDKVSDWSSQTAHDLFTGDKAFVKWPAGEIKRYVTEVDADHITSLLFQLRKYAIAMQAKSGKAEEKANGNGKAKKLLKAS
jgi:hypothetical protein